jgi:hypothetical protein
VTVLPALHQLSFAFAGPGYSVPMGLFIAAVAAIPLDGDSPEVAAICLR